MRNIETTNGVVDISEDVLGGYTKTYGRLSLKEVSNYGEKSFRAAQEFIEGKKILPPKNYRHLIAHGNSTMCDFYFVDHQQKKKVRILVDDWIDMYQADYDLLIVNSCNTGSVSLSPRTRAGILFSSGLAIDQIFLARNSLYNCRFDPRLRYVPSLRDCYSSLSLACV